VILAKGNVLTEETSSKRVLIFIVAYNAEKTIQQVLRRIPVDQMPRETDVLVIDDASSDLTFRAAEAYRKEEGDLNITVLYNPDNQGYGGNQKLGYAYAIEHGYDVVALVHGDGQYAPEKLPELIKPVLDGEADACFGSRMIERGAALTNGMPRYKYVGNKILTWFENFFLGTDLSEFHSGYRIYSVPALAEIPFRHNTNDFHFDTDIIIQFVLRGLRIREIPIPTYYGDEICHVNGMAYAGNVVLSILGASIHRMGLLYQRKFDVDDGKPHYDLKQGYCSSHVMAVEAVDEGARVLDLACGPGYVAHLLTKKGCHVTGLDRVIADEPQFDGFIEHDLNAEELPPELGTYDTILALDCIEHLAHPERFLALLRQRCYAGRTRFILTTPNIAVFPVRLALLLGQFNYGPQGVLDLTHTRLFTFRSLKRMLDQEGYDVLRVKGIPAPFPKALGGGWLGRMLLAINQALIFVWPTMFSYQIFVEARFRPPLKHLLSRAVETSARAREDEVGDTSPQPSADRDSHD
jgi:glycosyltransferase involved in cell wall biosynthesis